VKSYHFISGLPRSGSTLLAAILHQNPYFHAGITSPVAEAMLTLQQALSRQNEAAGLLTDAQRQLMLRGLLENYYSTTSATAVFDTNRRWCNQTAMLKVLFPESKIICMVRDPRWIVNSVEILRQHYPLELNRVLGFKANTSVYDRAATLMAPTGLLGYAMNALKSAYYGQQRDQLVIVNYDDLCSEPARCIGQIYQVCGIPPFEHDFDLVTDLPGAELFDDEAGLPGMHTVWRKVASKKRKSLLPPDLWEAIPPPFWLTKSKGNKGRP
jgi:sulfotransferase